MPAIAWRSSFRNLPEGTYAQDGPVRAYAIFSPRLEVATTHDGQEQTESAHRNDMTRVIQRAARVSYAFVLMNYAAVAGFFSLVRRSPLWR